jgi:hypothetical protein
MLLNHRCRCACYETKFQVINRIKEKAMETYENTGTIDDVKIVFPDSWVNAK